MNSQKSVSKPPVKSSKRSGPSSGGPRGKKPKPGRLERWGLKQNFFLLGLECLGLLSGAALTTMLALGYAANRFGGSSFFSNLLPFAVGVVCLIVATAVLLILWGKLRLGLLRIAAPLPASLAVALGLAAAWYIADDGYAPVFTDFRGLVGGKQQAAKNTLAHQVYAAYRRYDAGNLQKMIDRSQAYTAAVKEAAVSFDLDADLLLGVAATESSFLPRDSFDGGHCLFQITAVPKFLLDRARKQLAVDKLSLVDPRHNAYVAAATLKHYLAEMHNDLFLGLLAYNIGPRNGGLKFIMEQYGATDFVTMQPYFQELPRDYPIRVLSYSLAFRLWRQDGKLLAYQEGDNAVHIQRAGIPGLETVF